MSRDHTLHLAGTNSFDYLTALQELAQGLRAHSAERMPWDYGEIPQRSLAGGSAGFLPGEPL